jgi:hypothetical protein
MRRILLVSACLGILFFAGTGTALARGPNHRPPAVHHGHDRGPHGGLWQSGYRGVYQPYCAPRRRVAAFPAYSAPIYGVYPQLGFGVAGPNFSFWVQR